MTQRTRKPQRRGRFYVLNRAEVSALRQCAARTTRHSGDRLNATFALIDYAAAGPTEEERAARRHRKEAGHAAMLRKLGRLAEDRMFAGEAK